MKIRLPLYSALRLLCTALAFAAVAPAAAEAGGGDFAALVATARALLSPGGLLYFSTNLRTFRLDPQLAADRACADITRQTLPEDFRDPRIHHAFRIGPA